jgi:hypothetical protein
MFSPSPVPRTTAPFTDPGECEKRRFRWQFFRFFFGLTYIGIVLDVLTTALGVMKIGPQYEQNPLGGTLIGGLGWIGLLLLLTTLCLICYYSFRTVYWRMALGWSMFLNIVVVMIAATRWLAVVTAVVFILSPAA